MNVILVSSCGVLVCSALVCNIMRLNLDHHEWKHPHTAKFTLGLDQCY